MTPIHYSYLDSMDPDIADVIRSELHRQQNQIELIASENFTSLGVMVAAGSVLTNKYAEGYPGRRYYGGCHEVDKAERLAIERLCELFECEHANVQPHAGAQANQAVYLALLEPGDAILGMDLACGGHLTHGSPVNMSGKWFHAYSYGVDKKTHRIDYGDVEAKAKAHKPKLIIAGGSAYARTIDFKRFREIADEIGAYLMVDMAHYAGLIAGKVYPSPIPHAHVVTTTTHKTLRGPRGGAILMNDDAIAKKINSAVFPGNQGGPLMHIIAAKAVAFKEALQPSFRTYARAVVDNAQTLTTVLQDNNVPLISQGTDSHLILVDLSSYNLSGEHVTSALDKAGITCNKNSIPYDPQPPSKTSGIRLGSPAMTTRGFGIQEFTLLGEWICNLIKACVEGREKDVIHDLRSRTLELCEKFPLYPELQEK